MLSFRPDGSDLRVFASGLRNPYGLAVDGRGRIWATDNGRDEKALGAPDELDLLQAGHRYGFPGLLRRAPRHGLRRHRPAGGPVRAAHVRGRHRLRACELRPADGRRRVRGPLGDVLRERVGRYVARVHLRDGSHRVEPFVRGLDHPLAVTFAKDGALLVADWGSGIVWRIARR